MTDQSAVYEINEGSLPMDVPGTWDDQTIHVLRLPGDGQAAVSLVITRELLPVGMEVQDYTARELDRLKATLPEFDLRGRTKVEWEDVAGEALLTRWRSEQGPMDQITACRRSNGRRLLIFTATHPSPMPNSAYDTLMAAISGFRPRQQNEPAPIQATE